MSGSVLANYHTHTTRCHHADGSDEEYVQTAIRAGYQVLGFSDHTPWRYADPDFVSRIRMPPEELEGYVRSIQALREKYSDQIRLHVGLEVEYFPSYLNWLQEESQRLGIQYWVFGCHYDTSDESGLYFGRPACGADLRRYAEQVEAGLETGLYQCLAHPDLCLNRWHSFDEDAITALHEICKAAAKHHVPLEYNLAGLTCQGREDGTLGYTTDRFWEIAAQYPVQAIVGCDAHAPEELDLVQLLRAKQDYLRSLGITVLDTLPGLE